MFIGSHLVDALVERGASVRVGDNLSSGKVENIKGRLDPGRIEFHSGDMRAQSLARRMVKGSRDDGQWGGVAGDNWQVDEPRECPILISSDIISCSLRARITIKIIARSISS